MIMTTMQQRPESRGTTFYAIGLSYKKADAKVRGKFSLDAPKKEALLVQAKSAGISNLIVTSTCNRTELYGFAEHPFQLISMLCKHSNGSVEEFAKISYVHKNQEREQCHVHHLIPHDLSGYRP